MNKEHFEIAAKHYKELNEEQIRLIQKLTEVIDDYEGKTSDVVGADLYLSGISISWDGEAFT